MLPFGDVKLTASKLEPRLHESGYTKHQPTGAVDHRISGALNSLSSFEDLR